MNLQGAVIAPCIKTRITTMAKLTEQQQNELAVRNENIADRFALLMEQSPFGSANKVITYLAGEYQLTPQSIGRILREQGIDTTTPKNVQL